MRLAETEAPAIVAAEDENLRRGIPATVSAWQEEDVGRNYLWSWFT